VPTYEYQCDDCKIRFEKRQRFDSEPISICPECNGKSRRVIHSVPVLFKGSGFYCTDNGRGRVTSDNTSKDSESKETGVEANTEAKTEAKTGAGVESEAKTTTTTKTKGLAEENG